MQKEFKLRLLPSEATNDVAIKKIVSQQSGKKISSITGFHILKHSIDARSKTTWINLTLNAFIDEPYHQRSIRNFEFLDVTKANRQVVIVGAGPAGLFAALQLIELGIRPVILERGKDVRARRRDLAILNKEGVIDPESNYCFGEGGAGTYSDGKLYTRSNKRGDINRILHLFVRFGAEEKILYEAHPHIGTNKLPHIIVAMREQITACGGAVLFEKKLIGFEFNKDKIIAARTADGDYIKADSFILATGHSARDVFQLLHDNKVLIEGKPFALGVRIEHPQSLIDSIQYSHGLHNNNIYKRPDLLPPSSYSLVQQVSGHAVFSFCMCPGGIIAPASTAPGELVVNGWSPSKRNNEFANSGIVVQVEEKNVMENRKWPFDSAQDALKFMEFQSSVEHKCYQAGGGKFVAPAQRMVDFCNYTLSGSLPDCSYLPGVYSYNLKDALPGFVYDSLVKAFREFGKKMKGYLTNEAIIVATESRTSSPVRIPRDPETLAHPQYSNLFPCGEGAGYAGGIVSAAMDGERVAKAVHLQPQKKN